MLGKRTISATVRLLVYYSSGYLTTLSLEQFRDRRHGFLEGGHVHEVLRILG
jgi:hypothetical protein